MKSIRLMTREDLKDIKLIVFDVDGVLVPRGTKISQKGDVTTFHLKKVPPVEIDLMRKLNEKGFYLNVNSGRGLYVLQEMFHEILPFVSLTYENGSATWFRGKIHQHVNGFEKLKEVNLRLREVKDSQIKGFEPKEFIITIHCKDRVKKIEDVMRKFKELYFIWNGEAYDIGVKEIQTKATGLLELMKILNLQKENVMAVGDNFNDVELLKKVGISVCADKSRVAGNFSVPLKGKFLPAEIVMKKIAEVF
jgi:HAD superfamily hydrolase (TIGR01484 family)